MRNKLKMTSYKLTKHFEEPYVELHDFCSPILKILKRLSNIIILGNGDWLRVSSEPYFTLLEI